MTTSRPTGTAATRASLLAAVVCAAVLALAPTAAATPRTASGLLPGPGADATTSTTTDADRTTTTIAAGGALAPTGVDPAEAAAARDDDDDGTSPLVLVGIGVLGAVLGLGVGWAVGRGGARAGTAPAPAGAPAPYVPPPAAMPAATQAATAPAVPTAADPGRDQAVAHRDQLVHALIEVGDLVTSDAVRTQLVEHLRRVGVAPLPVPPGTPFDPGRHRGVQAVAAPEPGANGTVATCDRPGWVDGDRLIRLPEVVVYRWEEPS